MIDDGPAQLEMFTKSTFSSDGSYIFVVVIIPSLLAALTNSIADMVQEVRESLAG